MESLLKVRMFDFVKNAVMFIHMVVTNTRKLYANR